MTKRELFAALATANKLRSQADVLSIDLMGEARFKSLIDEAVRALTILTERLNNRAKRARI